MHFASYEFFVLFAVVGAFVCLAKHRLQNYILLVASYVFYGWWDWRFLGLLLISSLVDYQCGLLVDRRRRPDLSQSRRKLVLAASICVNLGMLSVFKYFDFFASSLLLVAEGLHVELHLPLLKVILPIGISFYTFQTMSYTIDVYRGKLPATDRLLDFMLYVSFFPQLVAGPIERAVHLLPQVLRPRKRLWSNVSSGAQLALVGFFKKMVIADNIALIVNQVYGQSQPDGAGVLIATYAFAIQIYCDFSGYTDIARGIARMLGFQICENFRLPYFATSPSEFWRCWHISLSSWLRDYLYIPLGGSRSGAGKTLRNLAITMLLGGLWHGAAWHFVAWGAFHGLLLIVYQLAGQLRGSHGDAVRPHRIVFCLRVLFFFQLTCLGWLIFRATGIDHCRTLLLALADVSAWQPIPTYMTVQLLAAAVPLLAFQAYQFRCGNMEPWTRWPLWLRVPFYLVLFYSIVLLGAPVNNEFIYFQF